MRHLRSILYCLILAPAVWILCGVGFDQDLTGRARDDGGIESLTGVLLLLLAGAAYAFLLFSPISPLGPLLSGLGFAGVGAWARLAPDAYAGVWPANVAKDGFDLSRPGYGLAVLLAMPMLATALSARRWRAFEPPEILLIGTIGRARGAAQVAGTPMSSERTTVIPQQRHTPEFVPGFGMPAGDPTQFVAPAHQEDDRTVAIPLGRPPAAFTGDDDERTTALPIGRPPATHAEDDDKTTALPIGHPPAAPADDEPTRFVLPAARGAADDRTAESPTVSPAEAPTQAIAESDETTSEVTVAAAAAEDETTRNVVAARAGSPASVDTDDKTQMLVLPAAGGQTAGADHDERTQVIRTGTVEPPGDRTQLLTFPTPGEATTVTIGAPDAGKIVVPEAGGDPESTKAMSIVAAERPDPGEDPTTRLTPPGEKPTEATARPKAERGATTVTSIERPADEAADDTRPLTLPAPRPPAEDETTRLH